MTPGIARAGRLVGPLQVVAGAAFVTASATLYSLLYVALPTLLIWVAAVAHRDIRPLTPTRSNSTTTRASSIAVSRVIRSSVRRCAHSADCAPPGRPPSRTRRCAQSAVS